MSKSEEGNYLEVLKDNTTVVLCTLNEEAAIGDVIDDLKAHGFSKILVVDGGSKDKTRNIAMSKGVEVIEQVNSGKAGAVITAINYVKTEFIAFMDADRTYYAEDLEKLLPYIRSFVEVIGKRKHCNMTPLHRFGNWVINKLFSIAFSTDVGDVLSGMYILRTDLARKLDLESRGFEIEVEIASQMSQFGKIVYKEINYGERLGETKLSSFKDGLKIILYLFKMIRIQNPVLFLSILAGLFILPGLTSLLYAFIVYVSTGIYHSGYALMGSVLTIVGVQGLLMAGVSSMLKRMERRIEKNFSSCSSRI